MVHQKHKKKSLWNDNALEDDLEAMGLRTKSMESDGNCFFRALGDQLFVRFELDLIVSVWGSKYVHAHSPSWTHLPHLGMAIEQGNEERHTDIREQVLQFLVDNREMFEVFIADDETFEHYVSRMREVWTGHVSSSW